MIDTKNKTVLRNMLEYTLYDDINMEDRLFVSWEMFEQASDDLHGKLARFQKDRSVRLDGIYGIPKGGLVLAVKLSYMLKLPLVLDPADITKNTLIVDDCTKTGRTLSRFKDNITMVMFHNPDARFEPDLCFQEAKEQINFCWESMDERN